MWWCNDIPMPKQISQRAHDLIELGDRATYYIHKENE